MTEERITETTDASGNTHTTHVVSDRESGGSAKWVFLLILVVAIGAAVYFFTQTNASEIAKDNAVAEAAGDVGEAAGQVGEAANDVADSVTGGE